MRTFLLLLILFFFKSAYPCEHPLVLSFNGDWPPYFYKVGEETYVGSDFDILSRTLDSMSCTFNVLPMTPERAQLEMSKGTFDIFVGASYTNQRNLDFFYTTPYRKEYISYAYNTKNLTMNTNALDDILENDGYVAINIQGYFGDYVEALKQRYPDRFIHAFSAIKRMQMLNEGVVSVVIDDKSVLCKDAKRFTNKPRLKSYKISDQILHHGDIHFIFNRSTVTPQFVKRFNDVLSTELINTSSFQTDSCS
ncbi:transporter substrate-binding domain-containing protein [Alteromonas sp. 5E99-2]|uniref:substrate-binding periplasmic protein n=1 Tax=Alteromonas sp. 5E99-2 TaxID=2817683 RepID=UPI001A986021|nr:transporter substrate-binding domain-containing protein [Alteromonas sp. 5E99-2]MBO1254445.1 transporter substrate-binding domain-containing protein [Alteromonas sp. 5E99-2]